MRGIIKSTLVTIAAILGAALLALMTTFTSAVTLAATTALIVPGTGTPKPDQVLNYLENANTHYLVPAGDCSANTTECTVVGIPYIAQFWPIPLPGWGGLSGAKWNVSVQSGLDGLSSAYGDVPSGDPITIFGYSQGATVATMFKSTLDNPTDVSFFFIGDPQRPNGGFFERWAILGTVPILDATFGNPAPTDTCAQVCATDFAFQYDGVADFPEYPINALATLNALAGFAYVHGTYLAPDGDEAPTEAPYGYSVLEVQQAIAAATATGGCTAANYCQTHGDTIYITLPARVLPIMQPALDLGTATGTSGLVVPIVDLISPFTQTLIETGYDRSDYGAPTPARLIPRINPVTLAGDLIQDIPEGIHAALNPGLDPLPGSVPTPSVTTLTEQSATTPRRPLIPVNIVAKPNLLAAANKPGGQTVGDPLGIGSHPVRDVVDSVTGVVKKVLGPKTNAANTGAPGDNAA